eukprot:COSAG03_NODE_31_length_18330_cov_15.424936_12_plen_70_part_00
MVEHMGVGAARGGGGTTPMIALKIAYFLTDTTIPDCGAMRVIPGTLYLSLSLSLSLSLFPRPRYDSLTL